MKYRQFKTNFWYDGYVSSLSVTEKLFFIYLFTNSRVDKVGIYELPDKFLLNDLGIDPKTLDALKTKFENDARFYFYKDWIYVANWKKNNNFSTAPNILNDFKKEFDRIPHDVQDHFFKLLPYELPIENTDKVTVTVKERVIVIVNRLGRLSRVGRVGKMNEDIDPDTIPDL